MLTGTVIMQNKGVFILEMCRTDKNVSNCVSAI